MQTLVAAAGRRYGVGLMLQLIGTPMALSGSMANGTEGIRFYVGGGYSF